MIINSKSINIGAGTAAEGICPTGIPRLAACPGYMCEIFLKSTNRSCINRLLRKIIVDVSHAENRVVVHSSLKLDLDIMPIELLGMATRPDIFRLVRPERQQTCNTRMTISKHPLVEEAQHANVPSQIRRGKCTF